jgi:chitinase
MKRRLAAAAAAVAVVAASAIAMQGTSEAAVLPNNFKSVGYMPSWAGSVNSIQYSKLTHINYAFVLPNSNGTLQAVPDPAKLQSLVSLGHQNNVKVGLALGGWNDGNDSAFEALAGNSGARTTFVNAVMGLVGQYNLDGIDIDWEYPDPGTSGNNYTALMQQLSTALHGQGKLLTAAVVSEGGTANGVQPAVFGMVDWLNIMAYDGGKAAACPRARRCWASPSTAVPVTRRTRRSSRPTRPSPTRTARPSAACRSATTACRRSAARPSGPWPTPAAS